MFYLIAELYVFVLAAFVIGIIIGWLSYESGPDGSDQLDGS